MKYRTTLSAAVAASFAFAAPAYATITSIPGVPLTVNVTERGQLQAIRAGDQGGIFYPTDQPTGDAGFFLAFPTGTLAGHVYGFQGYAGPDGLDNYTPVSQGGVSGSGSAADPYAVATTYSVSTVATVRQTTSYINGAQEFRVRWEVTNESGAPLPFKALAAADFYFEGSDVGTGIFSPGPPRFVGGTNTNTGRSGGFIESTPWDSWQALSWDTFGGTKSVWTDVVEQAANSTAASFDKSIETRTTDNAGGVEWDGALTSPLAAHATRSYELAVRSAAPAALQFDRTSASAPKGTPVTFVATATDTSGQPFAGKALRYSITGPNPGTAAVTLDANGSAAITDPGTNAGSDALAVYVDLNGNGTRESNEPQAGLAASFAAPADTVPPACTAAIGAGRLAARKPVVVNVRCDSPANLVVRGSFTVTAKRKKKVVAKASATATQALIPGKSVAVAVRVPSSIAKKYAGKPAAVALTVTAIDAAGNKATKTATRTVKLATVKKAKKKQHRR
jgi:hypothetical protein